VDLDRVVLVVVALDVRELQDGLFDDLEVLGKRWRLRVVQLPGLHLSQVAPSVSRGRRGVYSDTSSGE
jgi:hypothetical protein